jgi:hypothetical protein
MYEDIDFEIINCVHENGLVSIKIRVEETFEKYFQFGLSLDIFEKMNLEELEMLAYKTALQKVRAYRLNQESFDNKLIELKTKVNAYNEKIKN